MTPNVMVIGDGNSFQRMQGCIFGFGQAYLETSKDKDGDWLAGDNKYWLHVPPNGPIKQFWSIKLYDNVTRGPAVTDQGAPDLSSRKRDLISKWSELLPGHQRMRRASGGSAGRTK